MTGLYLLLWCAVMSRELGELRDNGNKKAMAAVWTAALIGLGLWLIWRNSQWRLAEWLLGGASVWEKMRFR
jgi:hypothetical protein